MQSILSKINDPKLPKLVDSVKPTWSSRLIPKYFQRITHKFLSYDPDFLWLLMYQHESNEVAFKYLEKNYAKYKEDLHILDSNFAEKLVKAGEFQSRVWEMVLCDVLSSMGELIAKTDAGPDLQVKINDQIILVEAVAPDESKEPRLQGVKPVYDSTGFFSHSGNVSDMELPTVLRFLQGFDKKAKKYSGDKSFIIAINTGKVVHMTSRDEFVLRQALFGLGCETITMKKDGTTVHGLQQKPALDKGGGPFPVARFRDPAFSHVSGVLYSSQKPTGLVPGGYGWSNSGITYVPNPMAKNPFVLSAKFLHHMTVTEQEYRLTEATEEWTSTLFP